jgi:hypothetical protein
MNTVIFNLCLNLGYEIDCISIWYYSSQHQIERLNLILGVKYYYNKTESVTFDASISWQ